MKKPQKKIRAPAFRPQKEYKLSLENYDSYCLVYIFGSKKSMRTGIEVYCDRYFDEQLDVEGTIYGLTIGPPALKKELCTYHAECFAVIFLNKEALDVYTIFHECLHAALFNENQNLRFQCKYSDENKTFNDESDEERLVYKQGYFAKKIIDHLKKDNYEIKLTTDLFD